MCVVVWVRWLHRYAGVTGYTGTVCTLQPITYRVGVGGSGGGGALIGGRAGGWAIDGPIWYIVRVFTEGAGRYGRWAGTVYGGGG